MFALVDCNNFYASCQRVFNPGLNGQPVVILSNNDGCVIARSNEAKALDIPMGAPAFQYEKMFREKNVHVFSSNYALYGDMSNRVMKTLGEFTPDQEIYSIDESFLKFKGFDLFDLTEYGRSIHRRVLQCTGIPVSVGIAPTKALAKIANRIAKKFPERTGSAYVIDSEDKRIKALQWVAIKDVWGIGRQHAERLMGIKIYTAYDFTQLPDAWVQKNMSIVGLRLKRDLSGLPTLDFEDIQPKKNIATTRSFEGMISDYEQLRERVATYVAACSEKLRRENSNCSLVTVFLKTNKHRRDLPDYNPTLSIGTNFPTQSTFELNKFAQGVLKIIYKEGYMYKKAGVIFSALSTNDCRQLNAFTDENPKHHDLMQVMDSINAKMGSSTIGLAGQDIKRKWKMKRERLSPNYTTQWEDVISVICR